MRRVTDAGDPALTDFARLTDVAARQVVEPAAGLFIAEGVKVIARALDAGLVPRRVLCSPRWYDEALAEALGRAGHRGDGPGIEVLLAEPGLLEDVTGFRVHRGALAAFERPAPRPVPEVLAGAGTIAVLVDLVDHTNVGAIFRNAAALGVSGILVTRRCADPWYRRCIKVSMGAVFAVPWTTLPGGPQWSGPGLVESLSRHGLATLALTPRPHAVDIRDLDLAGRPAAVLIGTEGPGLPDEVIDAVDTTVRIRMHHGVDSLNVAAASAIAFHALVPPADQVAPRAGRSTG